jgi:hydrogenase maturation protease
VQEINCFAKISYYYKGLEKLLLALGSDILMDDAISIMLARDIKQLFPNFDLQILPVGGIGLIELIAGFDLVVIIDTMISPDGKPGEIILYNGFQNAGTFHLQNPHDVDFISSLKLAEELGYRLPEKIVVLGIQVRQHLIASRDPSSWILEKYSKLLEQTTTIIRDIRE